LPYAGVEGPELTRRLAAILVGDVVGSTPAMQAAEEEAVARFAACLDAVATVVRARGGRVFATAGDALLAEFASPLHALRAALDARSALVAVPGAGVDDMRFGLHLADVLEVGSDLRGDGVNIAARIQSQAEPGQILVSAAVAEQVRRGSPVAFEDVGPTPLKGIAEPIHLFRVKGMMERHPFQQAPTRLPEAGILRPHSVAVLPFRAAGPADDDQRYLAEGLTEDLILELARRRRLFVSSRSASFALESADPVELGRRLGVRYVVSGSVRKQGAALRLNLGMTETASGRTVWSDRVDQPYAGIWDAMDRLTARIAATVFGRIEEADMATARRRSPASLDAYECYLRGVEHYRLGQLTDVHVEQAVDWFRRAAEADPAFAAPLAMEVCAASTLPGFDMGSAGRKLAKALELDPHDPEVNRVMGAYRMKTGDFDEARRYHERALDLAPNDAFVAAETAAFHVFAGEPERALELLDQAAELDPFLPVWCVEQRVAALYVMGRWTEALEAAQGLPFQTRRTRLYRAACRVAMGDLEHARQLVAEARAENPGLSTAFVMANEDYADRTQLATLLARLRQAGLPDPPASPAPAAGPASNTSSER
jgi:adenylate cyclase